MTIIKADNHSRKQASIHKLGEKSSGSHYVLKKRVKTVEPKAFSSDLLTQHNNYNSYYEHLIYFIFVIFLFLIGFLGYFINKFLF